MQSTVEVLPRYCLPFQLTIAGFGKVFGQYYEAKDKYALPAYLSSIMTSVPFFGKVLVCEVLEQC